MNRTGRGQSNRLWMAIKFGCHSTNIHTRHVEIYISCLHEFLQREGIRLENQLENSIFNVESEIIEASRLVKQLLAEAKGQKTPILFLIEDLREIYQNSAKDFLTQQYSECLYLFSATSEEMMEMVRSNDFSQAKEWCHEFVQEYIIQLEGREAIALDSPQVCERSEESYQQNIIEEVERRRSDQLSWEEESELRSDRRNGYQDEYESAQNVRKEDQKRKKEDPDETGEMVSFQLVCLAIETFLSSSQDRKDQFINEIAGARLFQRFRKIFTTLEKNQKFLELIVLALESATGFANHENVQKVLFEIAQSGYIEQICSKIMKEGDDTAIDILSSIMKVFLKAFDSIPWEDHHYFKRGWDMFYNLLCVAPQSMWEKHPDRKHWLETNVYKINKGEEEEENQPRSQPSQQQPARQRNFYENQLQNLWTKSEEVDPPENFRTLSKYPTKDDLIFSDKQYLRRSIVEGGYKNSSHYLDVQFRLFREDLIGPLREGLAIYKRTGMTRFDRTAMEDKTEASDLIVLDVISIRGVQVRANKGNPIRYIELDTNPRMLNASKRHLKYGQLIVLSCDNFERDINIGVIMERLDNELTTNGLLGVQFLNDSALEMRKPYVLVEPISYLEKYLAVFEVMMTINQFRPLPMERYLVQMKTSQRKPLYLKMNEEEDEEDLALERYYKEEFVKNIAKIRDREEDGFSKKSKLPKKSYRINIADDNQKKCLKIKGVVYEVDKLDEEFDIEEYDPSQRRALIYALTSEMALIQGPPGTVEIVRTILENRCRLGTNQPILLVCYTNSALDQFLEKILYKIREDIRLKRLSHSGPVASRLGTKSESAILEKEGLMKRQLVAEWKEVFAMEQDADVGKTGKAKRAAAMKLGVASYVVSEEARSQILSYEVLKNILPVKAQNEMSIWNNGKRDTKSEKLHMDEVLACWLLDKNLEESSGMGLPESDDESEDKRQGRMEIEDEEAKDLSLEEVFRNMNLKAAEHQAKVEENWYKRDDFDKYYETADMWDILKSNEEWIKETQIFKGGGMKKIPGIRGMRDVPFDVNICKELYENREYIVKAEPLREQEVEEIRSIYGLPKQRRWQLFAYWTSQMRVKFKEQIPIFIETYERECKNSAQALLAMDAAVLSRCLIIGATTTGAAKARDLLEKIGCRILIIEEAAEVLEAHTFASFLPTLEHAILIGDHQQLRPNPSVYELARTYNMDVSLFERLINNKAPYVTLEKQHRMHPEITNTIIKKHFYEMLKDADNVKEYPKVIGMKDRLFFWSHAETESTGMDGVSYYNLREVDMTTSLLKYFRKQGYDFQEITVIATYSAQVDLLKMGITQAFGMNVDNTGPVVAVETVDSFQGKENKIIIVSLVRSYGKTIGFLSVANRICVALTRAQHGMYILGNAEHLQQKCSLWKDIYSSLTNEDKVGPQIGIKCRPHGTEQKVFVPSDFEKLSPDGGCTKVCGVKLSCGHECSRKCHPLDDHETYLCKAPCSRTCSNKGYLHPCRRSCYEDCGVCQAIENVTLKCGHTVNVSCHSMEMVVCEAQCDKILSCGHQCKERCGKICSTKCSQKVAEEMICGHVIIVECFARSFAKCNAPCEERLACGHLCQNLCGELHTIQCKQMVEHILACGHNQTMECWKNPATEPCLHPMSRKLSCGHTSEVPCHAGTLRRYCTVKCEAIAKCGHPCFKTCGECDSAGRHSCSQPCKRVKNCGHRCSNFCGEPCSSCSELCLMGCVHLSCGQDRTKVAGTTAFNRRCNQQCVLCPKSCDNRCEHRACQRLCYQVCDVAPCEHRCKRILKCRHACLGICGEECPDICGTCRPTNYQRLILDFNLKENVAYKIIKIPSCGHLFPVSILDKYISELEKNAAPTCPICSSPIYNIKRYAKFIKQLAFDFYCLKELKRDLAIEEHKLREYFQVVYLDFNELILNFSKSNKEMKVIDPIKKLFTPVQSGFYMDIQKQEIQSSIWRGRLECYRSLIVMANYFLKFQISSAEYPKQIKTPALFAEFAENMINKGLIYNVVVNCLNETRARMQILFADSALCQVGVFIPECRYLLCRTLFYITIWQFRAQIARTKMDLSQTQVKDLRTLGNMFKNCTQGDDYYEVYLNFVKYINQKVLNGHSSIGYHLHPQDRSVILPQL